MSTFNSPQTTPKGHSSIGAGTVLVAEGADPDTGEEQNDGLWVEAFGRVGLADRWDVGAKVSPGLIFGDVKYQVVDARVDVAADLGVSAGGLFGAAVSAVYPAVFVGTERFYAGGRATMVIVGSDVGTLPIAVAGASVGNQFRIMPEVNVYLDSSTPRVIPGLGLQYRFGSNE